MVPREIIWWALEKKEISTRYIDVVTDVYNRVVIHVRTMEGETKAFLSL